MPPLPHEKAAPGTRKLPCTPHIGHLECLRYLMRRAAPGTRSHHVRRRTATSNASASSMRRAPLGHGGHYPAARGHLECLRYLIKGCPCDTKLPIAAREGHLECLRYLIVRRAAPVTRACGGAYGRALRACLGLPQREIFSMRAPGAPPTSLRCASASVRVSPETHRQSTRTGHPMSPCHTKQAVLVNRARSSATTPAGKRRLNRRA